MAEHMSSPFFFRDRTDAGRQLAHLLTDERTEDAIVVGIDCGGMAVAAAVADQLQLPLDGVGVSDIRHPWHQEHALGAATPDGHVFLGPELEGLKLERLCGAAGDAVAEARAIDSELHSTHERLAARGRNVLLVGDGLLTATSMIAAARWSQRTGARRIVAAAPIGAAAEIDFLSPETDRVVCPYVLADLIAVGIWYADFAPVSAQNASELLSRREPALRFVSAAPLSAESWRSSGASSSRIGRRRGAPSLRPSRASSAIAVPPIGCDATTSRSDG
jgi:putative phosphoribosyl transferase